MKRELKFRVFDKITNTMHKVAQIHYADDGFDKTIIVLKAPRTIYMSNLVHGESCELMQFTGLIDKYGKDIYEGDVLSETIEVDGKLENSAIPVLWNNVRSSFCVDHSFNKDGSYLELLKDNYKGMHIIGNIYENPLLLKRNK